MAKELGYQKILLHTQTNTWLAAKIYLDCGFEPFNIQDNKGWDISLSANKFVKYKKFSMSANFNIAQNQNELLAMDERVLRSLNGNDEYTYTNRGASSRMDRVQVGNALCSIYGYRYQGVYQYSYQWLTNQQKEHSWDAATYEEHINQWLYL